MMPTRTPFSESICSADQHIQSGEYVASLHRSLFPLWVVWYPILYNAEPVMTSCTGWVAVL